MLCRSVYAHGFTAGQKAVEIQDWATGPPGRGGWWVDFWRAAGHGAAGPWAVGLLLPKPIKSGFPQIWTKLWHKSKNRFCLYFDHR